MLVTFKCKAYADITMFGDVGERMLELMGFGKQVPGALSARDVEQALQNLRDGLATLPEDPQAAGDEDADEPSTSLQTRAMPLLELLQAANLADTQVRWE